MDIITTSEQRYSAKKFDTNRKIDDATLAKIETLLRTAPSSVNAQPWHYIIAGTEQGRNLIAQAAEEQYSMNIEKIRNASHVVVFCVRDDMDEEHLDAILNQEEHDGRFTPEKRSAMENGRKFLINLNRPRMHEWLSRQVFLSFGYTLMGIAALGVDGAPIEGIDVDLLDKRLQLREKGLRSLAVLCLGYHAEDDFNAKLPKSRLPAEYTITHI